MSFIYLLLFQSFKGECGCSEGYNQNYWPETGECFEWYSQGPCPESFLFVYNRKEGKTECICDEQDGFVFWNETGRCYRVYSQVRKQPTSSFDLIAGYKYVYTQSCVMIQPFFICYRAHVQVTLG